LRVVVVYTAFERIHFSPPMGRWPALTRRPLLFCGHGASWKTRCS